MTRFEFARAAMVAVAAALVVSPAVAIDFRPFKGIEGYQEIQVAPDVYFVAFHGVNTRLEEEVDLAWQARAGQLCAARGYFVPLQYSFEPILKGERSILSKPREAEPGRFLRVARGGN